MKCQLFPFQSIAVNRLRMHTAEALGSYKRTHTPQVVSLQAPTGAGKTIIISALIEAIYCGTDKYVPQPDAIFVWLSDSPSLNEQSKQKIEAKADKIRLGQCITIEDESFDQYALDNGYIYFLNTQKLSKSSNLSKKSDSRQYTIWETIQNTLTEKADRLYFIIDEAHRGALGTDAGRATSIMQRFLKGSPNHGLSPLPLVIGMSATAERFNKLVAGISSTLHNEYISASAVRESGLLKDRIIVIHPDDMQKYNDMAVLDRATDEWIEKCRHWRQYCTEQHYKQVEPAFLIQVKAGSGKSISNTDLVDVLGHIEKRLGRKFDLGEVVHTFGSKSDFDLSGLKIFHVEPEAIADNRKIKVVFFKENLSTGWDCPRAEAMMSFRTAEDTTYIAQLLGRMVRTPLQNKVLVDDYLNDVRLFLPYFNKDNVEKVVKELRSSEVDDIPVVIDEESIEVPKHEPWHVRPIPKPAPNPDKEKEPGLFDGMPEQPVIPIQPVVSPTSYPTTRPQPPRICDPVEPYGEKDNTTPDSKSDEKPIKPTVDPKQPIPKESTEQIEIFPTLDREKVLKYINDKGLITYIVRTVQINDYLKSVLALAELLTSYNLYPNAIDEITKDMVEMIHKYIQTLKASSKYMAAKKQIMQMKLSMHIFDIFGAKVENIKSDNIFVASDEILDPQLNNANARLGYFGLPEHYARYYFNDDDPSSYKIDCILFAASDECLEKLGEYSKDKFHELDDRYRGYVADKGEKCLAQYRKIVADGDVVSKHVLRLPELIDVKISDDGTEYKNHLYANDNGIAKMKLNTWEQGVLEEEFARPDFVCWLRNPDRKSWSLCLPYEMESQTKGFYPDFIIVRSDPISGYAIDILEPHGDDYKDNLAKAKSLAKYVKDEPRIRRVQMIRKLHGKFVRLDFSDSKVRAKVEQVITSDDFDKIFQNYGFTETK